MLSKRRTEGPIEVLELSGKITIGEGEAELRRDVQDLLDSGRRKILISLERVTFMDSAGLGELVACYKRAVEKQGTIKILKPNEKLLDLFTITKLIEIFDIYENEKDAIKAFS